MIGKPAIAQNAGTPELPLRVFAVHVLIRAHAQVQFRIVDEAGDLRRHLDAGVARAVLDGSEEAGNALVPRAMLAGAGAVVAGVGI
ncbi:MAG: hypothetical protein BWY76_02369 [bacterium ADurb.Bin429]|nr:MAG: hypothetical protein BWY76_02369 [bacterium ADurb.Bin429]